MSPSGSAFEEEKDKPSSISAVSPLSRALTVVALGDSLTEGYGVRENQSYPSLLNDRLHCDGFPCRVINAGISGETSSELLHRIPRILLLKPDIVILCTGANDGLMGVDTVKIRDAVSRIIRKLTAHQLTIVLAGMKMLVNYDFEYAEKFNRLYPEIAAQEQVIFIPFLLEGVWGNPAYNFSDGIHPNADGYRIILESIYPFVSAAVKSRLGGV